MEFKTSTYQKVGVVYGILVILVLAALGVRFIQGNNLQKSQKTPTVKNSVEMPKSKPSFPGKLSLASQTTTARVGENVEVVVYFEASGKTLDGSDIILRFDPQILSALGFSEGTYFKLVPRKDIDNTQGAVKVTALDSSGSLPLTGQKTVLGTVSFQAQAPGTTAISFDYTPGTSAKTTLIEQGTSQNILGEASGINITVTE